MGIVGRLGDYIASIAGRVGHSRPVFVAGIARNISCSSARVHLIVSVLSR